jgi:hypothetical protein
VWTTASINLTGVLKTGKRCFEGAPTPAPVTEPDAGNFYGGPLVLVHFADTCAAFFASIRSTGNPSSPIAPHVQRPSEFARAALGGPDGQPPCGTTVNEVEPETGAPPPGGVTSTETV